MEKNPLAGLYFAVEQPFTESDLDKSKFSAVYIYKPKKLAKLDSSFNPFSITMVKRFIPKHWDPRIVAQGGIFTVHPKPYQPWEPKNLDILLIHNKIRKKIKKTLNRLGVHAGTMYPDLDGISEHIKWLRSDNH